MKKNYIKLLSRLFLFASLSSAQSQNFSNVSANLPNQDTFSKKIRTTSRASIKSLNTSGSRWFDYGQAVSNYFGTFQGDSSAVFSYPTFPDSTLKFNFSNGLGNSFHCIGNVLQPTDTLFNNEWYNGSMKLLPTSNYTVDTVATEIFYVRNITNVTDSLIIKIGVNPTPAQSTNQQFVSNVFFYDNFGDSIVKFKNVPYNFTKNELGTLGNSKRIAIALDSAFFADTTSYGTNLIVIPTTDLPQVNAGSCVYTTMSFKPGFTWNPNVDTLNKKNYIRYFYYKEQNTGHDNVIRYYRDDSTGTDFNRSYLANTKVRYNNASTFNGRMYPRNVYGKTSSQDQYYFQYKLSSNNASIVEVGVNENRNNNASVTVFPNPTSNLLNVNLTKNISSIIKISTINGSVLYTENVANKATVTFDLSTLAKGIYIMQVISDKGIETKKIIKQ